MPPADEIELENHTQKLIEQYQSLETLLNKFETRAEEPEPLLEEFRVQMSAIKSTEALLQPLRERVHQAGEKFPAQLEEPTNRLVQILKDLLPRISNLENQLKDSARNLAPKISDGVKALQMQNAYHSIARTQ